MAKIYIDGIEYTVDDKKNLLDAVLSLKFDLPYFCWHPAMGSVGACRQCAVKQFKDEKDTTGMLVMACMVKVQDGMRISLEDPEAKAFRANVIEWLMTNHPHDCPICDEGGECHLQDMTVMSGHNYRRYRFKKRTYRNQYLGPFINHEMNRCIQCYRCVRFYNDYAGAQDLNAFAANNSIYFGRAKDGTLESEFSGNLVEVCPTGVFTDKTLQKHYTRKWDLTSAPSVCNHCGLGCNILASERYGGLRRILSRYSEKVNGYFLCDRGRFGYEFVNSEKRIKNFFRRGENEDTPKPMNKKEFMDELGESLKQQGNVIGIGSPKASLESNYALQKLVGKENFYNGISSQESKLLSKAIKILRKGGVRTPSMKEVENSDAVFILGEDLHNTAPMLALSVIQATRNKHEEISKNMSIPYWHDAAVREAAQVDRSPLFIASPDSTKLDEFAMSTFRSAPADVARLGFAVADRIDTNSPKLVDLSEETNNLAEKIAEILREAENPVIISGTSLQEEALLDASYNIAKALKDKHSKGEITLVLPENNSLGTALLSDQSLEDAFESADNNEINAAIILENNIYMRAENESVDKFLSRCKNVIALDYLVNKTVEAADYIIPAGTFAESEGTLVNNEGRAQRFYRVYYPEEEIQSSWKWIKELADAAEKQVLSGIKNLDDIVGKLSASEDVFNNIKDIAPASKFRIAGAKIPRETHRYSGRTAMNAHKNVHEPKPMEDEDSPMSFTMEGYRGLPSSSNVPYYWSPGWNSEQAINKFQIEVGGGYHDGEPGKRLVEPEENAEINYFNDIPKAFEPKENEFLFYPKHQIFGSDRLSMEALAVAERSEGPYVTMNKDDGVKSNLRENSLVLIEVNGNSLKLPVKFSKSMPRGVAGFPIGFPGVEYLSLPNFGRMEGVKE